MMAPGESARSMGTGNGGGAGSGAEQSVEAGASGAPQGEESRFGGTADKLLKQLVDAEHARCEGDLPADYNVIEFRKSNTVGPAPAPPPPTRAARRDAATARAARAGACADRPCAWCVARGVCAQVLGRARYTAAGRIADVRKLSHSARPLCPSLAAAARNTYRP